MWAPLFREERQGVDIVAYVCKQCKEEIEAVEGAVLADLRDHVENCHEHLVTQGHLAVVGDTFWRRE